ncbi:MAG: ParB/RepB/Spo0J family partition protein [Nitrososphaeraceae archaeon]|nr:ParB/RepB/Spo0J family partition protein [Nitrososphaeraceae archaeon]MBV9668525.1 ParB/RepB/Spo0J family partition protein [Nitrososphaeraceae archaeon]
MEFVDTSIVEQIEMKMIRPSQFAIRDRFQKMASEDETLICSIREHGLLQPILIRPLVHGFEIVAGHRRFKACRSLRWRFIPCKLREMSDKQAYEIQLTENIQRKSMDPIEEAEAFRRYVIDFGWGGVSELARKLGKSEEYISHRIQLLKLPDDIKQQILTDRLKVSQALELSNIPSERQSEIISQVINNNLTVRQIREVKSILREEGVFGDELSQCKSISKSVQVVRVTKKTSLALKVALARVDNLIDEVHSSIEPEQRAEITNFLMALRLRIHSMIDETIRFKNTCIRSTKR